MEELELKVNKELDISVNRVLSIKVPSLKIIVFTIVHKDFKAI